jgi:hypothetical protein
MILSSLVLPSRVNQRWKFSAMDHINKCFDKHHFVSYPHEITYHYNSRGFRDQEWPESIEELENAVWCIGDSFTVGLGSSVERTWPVCLSKITGHRVINVSMDGASNEWISRTAEKIIQEIKPRYLAIMWSYTHRREHTDSSLNDEQRRMHFGNQLQAESLDLAADWKNFLHCKEKIDLLTNSSVQFSIPAFHYDPDAVDIHACWDAVRDKDWPPAPNDLNDLNSLPDWILTELDKSHNCLKGIQQQLTKYMIMSPMQVDRLDIARDGHHFDLITAEWVATRAAQHLGLPTNSKN